MFIKNPVNAFAFIAIMASFSLVSCQKENILPETNTPSTSTSTPTALLATQTWLLLDTDWAVAVTPGQNGASDLQITRGTTTVSAVSSTVANLPASIVNELAKRGISTSSALVVWSIVGGGWFIEVPADANGTKNVFWFNAQNAIKSIGKVQG